MKRYPKTHGTDYDSISGTGKGSKKKKIFIALGITLLAAVIAVIVIPRVYYSNRWYANIYIGDENVSGMTLNASKSKLYKVYDKYKLEVKGRDDGSLVIEKNDIKYNIDIEATVKEQFDRQHSGFSLFKLNDRKNVEINPTVSYDKDALKKLVKKSSLVKGGDGYNIVKPKSASVSYSDDKKGYEIVKEVQGNKIVVKNLLAELEKALDVGTESMDISDSSKYDDIYKKPAITSDSQDIKDEQDAMNAAVLRWIRFKMSDETTEEASPDDINKWLTYKNGKVKYDTQAVRDWMEVLCLKYKTLGGERTFKSYSGALATADASSKQKTSVVKISGGDYGWCLDYENMVSKFQRALKKKIKSSKREAYISDPSDDNKKKLVISRNPVYSGTAYVQNFDDKMKDYDENNYTEVSIADQMVYVIRNGKVAFSCRCITGLPSDPERATKTGVYFVKEHKKDNILTGENYKTPVRDWVRISWTGTGFHEAHWQNWASWSKDMYKVKGSHGCINLSPQDADTIFDMVKYKEAVFVH